MTVSARGVMAAQLFGSCADDPSFAAPVASEAFAIEKVNKKFGGTP